VALCVGPENKPSTPKKKKKKKKEVKLKSFEKSFLPVRQRLSNTKLIGTCFANNAGEGLTVQGVSGKR
jgi:hypothetical protein